MKSRRLLIVMLLAVNAWLPNAARHAWAEADSAGSAQDTFNEAFLAESADRDLSKAILLYLDVMKHARDDAALAERAQLRIGICYEHLGKIPEAMDAYSAVLHISESPADDNDILQTATLNLKRLEARIQEEKAAAARGQTPPPVRIFLPFYHRLDVSFAAGPTYASSQTRGFKNGNVALWADAGYRLGEIAGVGIEGGYWQPVETSRLLAVAPGRALMQDDKVQSYYLGPFGEWAFQKTRLTLWVRTGIGLLFQKEDSQVVLRDAIRGSTADNFSNFSSKLASSSLIGVGWNWGPRLRLELSQKLLLVRLPSEGDVPDALQTYAPPSPSRWRALFTPALQLTWHFGSSD